MVEGWEGSGEKAVSEGEMAAREASGGAEEMVVSQGVAD